MKGRGLRWIALCFVWFLLASLWCFAAANGAWLRKVPAAERERQNPFAVQPAAVDAGRNLYRDNCAQCHGADAEGRHGRPALKSARLKEATDGDIEWMIKNGQMYRGMPSWGGLPEQERWQLVSYLRSLNID